MSSRARAVWVLIGLALTSIVFAVARAHANPGIEAEIAEERGEPLLLAVQIENVALDAILPTHERGADVLVPLGELCRALDLAIQVDPERGAAEGFFVSESRKFRLDARARTVRCGDRTFAWDSMGIVIESDDIYVTTELLATWFNLELVVRRQAAVLDARSATLLPIQMRAARARRVQQTLAGGDADLSGHRRVRTPYRLWSVPFMDQEFRSWTAAGNDGRTAGWQSATYAAADLLYLESDLYVRGDGGDRLAEVRGGAGRRDPDPVLLGPLRARQFRIGEVNYPGLALISVPASAPGVMVSNFPLERPSQFGEHTFRGRLPSGWDVELYRDGGLIGYQEARADGTYEFDRVPLAFGYNEFLVIRNGPHGERREERQVFNVGPSLTPPGTLNYRLVASGTPDTSLRAHLESDFHLTGHLSGSLALAALRLDDRAHYYVSTGLRGFWKHAFADAQVAVDSAGGQVVQLGVQTRSRRFGVRLRHDELSNGFRSEVYRSSLGRIESRSGVLLDAMLSPRRALRIPTELELTTDRLAEGRLVRAMASRVGLSFRRLSLSHEWRQASARQHGVGLESDARQALLVSLRVRDWSLRGGLDGSARGGRDAHLVAEGRAFGEVYAAMGLARDGRVRSTIASTDLRTDRGLLGWSARASIGTRSPLSLSLTLSLGLNREPRHGDWCASSRAVAGTGAASAQVFLDANGNGSRDAGEEALPGIGVSVNHAQTERRTDDQGVLFLSGLPPERDLELRLVSSSLEDPLWVAQEPGLRVVARPGRTTLVDFPVVISGEVAGTVSVGRPDQARPAAGVTLELADAATGAVVQRVTTAYDGYFDLLGVPPGRYQLRIAASQLGRFGLPVAPSRTIEISPSGTLLEGVDLLIEREPVASEGR